jgi:hypothetical protein
MPSQIDKLVREVSIWPGVSVHAHRFGGTEFRVGDAEVGHVHPGGVVDIPFPRSVRNVLLGERLAEPHHWLPNSGWITFHCRESNDLSHGVWLLRLSYLRYTLKAASDPHGLLQQEKERLQLSAEMAALFEKFVPAMAA